jgi:hypothetical protein
MPEIPTQPQPISNQKSINWKRMLVVAVIVAIVIGLGVLIFLILQPKEEPTTTNKTAPSANISTPSAEKDETADWKTIKGEISRWQKSGAYRFDFKAPNEFEITTPYPNISADYKKYYFGAEGSGITFFAGPMEGPGPLTMLYGRAAKSNLCPESFKLQVLGEGSFEVCNILQIDGRKALFLLEVYIRPSLHASACERDASLHVVYNLSEGTSLYFKPELEVLKEIIEPWDKVPTSPVYDDEGLPQVCPENIDYSKVKENLAAKIKSIKDAKGLSESDNRTLKTLYQVIATFKFLD